MRRVLLTNVGFNDREPAVHKVWIGSVAIVEGCRTIVVHSAKCFLHERPAQDHAHEDTIAYSFRWLWLSFISGTSIPRGIARVPSDG